VCAALCVSQYMLKRVLRCVLQCVLQSVFLIWAADYICLLFGFVMFDSWVGCMYYSNRNTRCNTRCNTHCNTHCSIHCNTQLRALFGCTCVGLMVQLHVFSNCTTHCNTHCNTHCKTQCNTHCHAHYSTWFDILCSRTVSLGFAAYKSNQFQIGDVAVAVDQQPLEGLELDAIRELTVGPEHTFCTLQMMRGNRCVAVCFPVMLQYVFQCCNLCCSEYLLYL